MIIFFHNFKPKSRTHYEFNDDYHLFWSPFGWEPKEECQRDAPSKIVGGIDISRAPSGVHCCGSDDGPSHGSNFLFHSSYE